MHTRRLIIGFTVVISAALGGVLATASPVSAVSCPGGWSATATGCERFFASGASSFTVPSGVTSLYVSATGARGGYGGYDSASTAHGYASPSWNRGSPGNVGNAAGWVPVSAGKTIATYVGSIGGDATSGYSYNSGGNIIGVTGSGGAGGGSAHGGYAGGAGGGGGASNWTGGGGGGGGASVVTVDGVVAVVGGGGGGGGGGSSNDNKASYAYNGTTGSYIGGNAGGTGTTTGGDGGGGGGGGGGYQGGAGGWAPGGETEGYGGSAGANYVLPGATSVSTSYIGPTSGSVYVFFLAPPALVSPPTVPAQPLAGAPVTGSQGSWSLDTSRTVQWLRCDNPVSSTSNTGALSIPAGCTAISGATSNTYTPTADDFGKYLSLGVTATNGGGSTSAVSASSGQVGIAPPVVDLKAASDTGAASTDNITSDITPTYDATNLVVGADVLFTATKGSDSLTCGPVAVTANPTSCSFPTMVDGTWNVTATQSFSGSTSSVSNTVPTVIDTDPPAAPIGVTLATASDTGVSSSDYITNDSTPTIDLTGLEVGTRAVVTASKPGSPDVTCVIATVTSTNQSCTFGSTLADGTWSFSAVQQDAAGNSSPATAPFTATIDTAAGVSLSSGPPATGTGPTAARSFEFTATLTDAPMNGSAFTASDVQLGGVSTGWTVGSITQVSPTEYRFTVSATTPTAGTLTVQVPSGSYEDAAGNTATASNLWTSTIITEPPANIAPPTITATTGTMTTLGSTLTSSTGTWDDKLDINPTTTYQWQVCDTGGQNPTGCVDVPGATDSTWAPTGIAEGKFVRSVVTRTNVMGSASQASAPTGPMVKAPQTIVFADPADRAFSPTPFAIAPVSNIGASVDPTGLAVIMTPTDPSVCTATATTVTMLKAGVCELTATQPGNDAFNAATPVVQSFIISKANQTATTTPSVFVTEPTTPVTLSTTQDGTGAVTYSVVSGPCTVSGTTVTATGVGDCVLSTAVAGDDRYNATTASNVTVKFRQIDAITAPATPDRLTTAGGFPWVPTANSGRAPTVTATGSCTYANGTVTPKAAPNDTGPCTLATSLPDDGTWSAATLSQTFNFAAPPSAPTNVSASVSGASGVAGATAQVSFTPVLNGSTLVDNEVTATPVGGGAPVTVRCVSSPCTVPGLEPGTAYTFTVRTNALTAGTPTQSPESSVSNQVTITAPHPVSLANPGRKMPTDAPFTLIPVDGVNPAGWSPALVSLTPSVCTVSGTTVTLVGTGTCELKASHPGGPYSGVDYGYGEAVVSFPVGAAPILGSGRRGAAPAFPASAGPVAIDDAVVTTAGASVSGSVATNDTVPSGSTFELVVAPSHGTVVVDTDGAFTYVPSPGFVGDDTFGYRVCLDDKCSSAVVYVTVTPAGQDLFVKPRAKAMRAGEMRPVRFQAWASTQATMSGIARQGTSDWGSTVAVPGKGTWRMRSGAVIFTPAKGFTGRTTIRYKVVDTHGHVAFSTFSVQAVRVPRVIDAGR